jgi:transposase
METYVEKVLIPELKTGQIIVLDNASFHKSKRITELIEAVECKVLFLPPYSPDLNPIENFWAVMKSKIKKYLPIFTNLNDTIDYVFYAHTIT